MIRTQVYLPTKLHQELKLIAHREKTTVSELVRRGARKVVAEGQTQTPSPLKNIVGLIKDGGPKDLSENLDYYLYVKPYE
jgi:metal-responsive CopG/Arc/MetJ family transcriptional regulator